MIVKKLVTSLLYKVDLSGLKKYDKATSESAEKLKRKTAQIQQDKIKIERQGSDQSVRNTQKETDMKIKLMGKILGQMRVNNRLLADAEANRVRRAEQAELASIKRIADRKIREQQRAADEARKIAERAQRDAEKDTARKNKTGEKTVAGGAALATGIAFRGLQKAVNVSGDIEALLLRIESYSGKKISKSTALKLAAEQSKSSQFKPTELLASQFELTKMGVNKPSDMKNVLASSVSLATAADITVAQASEELVTLLHTFNRPLKEADKFADITAQALNQSGLNFQDLVHGAKYSKDWAVAAGMQPEQLFKLMAFMGNRGIKGSTFGTSMGQIISRSSDTGNMPRSAKKRRRLTLDKIGIDAFDKNDNIDIIKLFNALGKELKGKKRKEVITMMKELFTQTAGKTGVALFNALQDSQGQASWKEMNEYFKPKNYRGISRKMQGEVSQGYNFNVSKFKSQVQLTQNTLTQQLRPAITKAFSALSQGMDKFNSAPESVKNFTAAFLVGVPVVTGYVATVLSLKLAIPIFKSLATWAGISNMAMLGMPLLYIAAAGAVAYFGYGLYQMLTSGQGWMKDFSQSVNDYMLKHFLLDLPQASDFWYKHLSEVFSNAESMITRWAGIVKSLIGGALSGFADWVINNSQFVLNGIKQGTGLIKDGINYYGSNWVDPNKPNASNILMPTPRYITNPAMTGGGANITNNVNVHAPGNQNAKAIGKETAKSVGITTHQSVQKALSGVSRSLPKVNQ